MVSCHDTVYLQGHDVTLQNQFSLMGISTALPWGGGGGQLLKASVWGKDEKGTRLVGRPHCFSSGPVSWRTSSKVLSHSVSQLIHLRRGPKRSICENERREHSMAQGSASTFGKGPDSKYLWVVTTRTWMIEATSQ